MESLLHAPRGAARLRLEAKGKRGTGKRLFSSGHSDLLNLGHVAVPDEFKSAAKQLEADSRIKLRRFAYGVYGIVTRDYDYAHTPRWTALVNREAWQLLDRAALEVRVSTLCAGDAFDLGRAVILLRAAVALGYFSDDESWSRVLPVLRALQTQCSSWEDYLTVYLRGRRRWLELPVDGSKDTPDMKQVLSNVIFIRKTVWRTTPFRLSLE